MLDTAARSSCAAPKVRLRVVNARQEMGAKSDRVVLASSFSCCWSSVVFIEIAGSPHLEPSLNGLVDPQARRAIANAWPRMVTAWLVGVSSPSAWVHGFCKSITAVFDTASLLRVRCVVARKESRQLEGSYKREIQWRSLDKASPKPGRSWK